MPAAVALAPDASIHIVAAAFSTYVKGANVKEDVGMVYATN
jgi:hypothetical protein